MGFRALYLVGSLDVDLHQVVEQAVVLGVNLLAALVLQTHVVL